MAEKNLIVGQEILVYGKFDSNRKTMSGIKIINETKNQGYNSIYSVNSKITQKSLKQIIEQAYSEYQDVIEDFVPNWIIKKYRLENLKNVIKTMHFPKSQADVKGARRTAKFNEFFCSKCVFRPLKVRNKKVKKLR